MLQGSFWGFKAYRYSSKEGLFCFCCRAVVAASRAEGGLVYYFCYFYCRSDSSTLAWSFGKTTHVEVNQAIRLGRLVKEKQKPINVLTY